jgi:hypothetical protein
MPQFSTLEKKYPNRWKKIRHININFKKEWVTILISDKAGFDLWRTSQCPKYVWYKTQSFKTQNWYGWKEKRQILNSSWASTPSLGRFIESQKISERRMVKVVPSYPKLPFKIHFHLPLVNHNPKKLDGKFQK